MTSDNRKHNILTANGYQYNFVRGLYYNKKTKKVFSDQALDEHDEDWLIDKINEKQGGEWKFYANLYFTKILMEDVLKDLQ